MKLAILNTWGSPAGGAALAVHRLHHALRELGVDSTLLVVDSPPPADPSVVHVSDRFWRLARWAEKWALRRYPKPWPGHSVNLLSRARVLAHPAVRNANAVMLGWVGQSYLSTRQIRRLQRPVVWRLSDCWPFTGGCHYPGDCRRFEDACGACPQLPSDAHGDVTRQQWIRKSRAYPRLDLHVAAPSRWIHNLATRSSLFSRVPVHWLPSGVDTGVFVPRDANESRQRLGIPCGQRVLLFGAVQHSRNPRKGGALLREALGLLANDLVPPPLHLAIFGEPPPAHDTAPYPFPTTHLGRIESDADLARVYPAADLFVAPSIEDNLPNTVMEAMACGVPCAGFAVGGIPELIHDTSTGWLAEKPQAQALAATLRRALGSDLRPPPDRVRSHIVEHYDLSTQARKYKDLVATLIQRRASP